MKRYLDLRISTKLLIAFSLLLVISLIASVFGLVNLIQVKDENADLFENYGNSQGYLGVIQYNFEYQRYIMVEVNLMDDVAFAQSQVELIQKSDEEAIVALQKFKKTCQTKEELEEFDSIVAGLEAFKEIRDRAMAYALDGDFDASKASIIDPDTTTIFNDLNAFLVNASDLNLSSADAEFGKQEQSVQSTITVMIIIMALSLVVAMTVAIVIAQIISRPLRSITKIANGIAKGDTSADCSQLEGKDEVGQLAKAFDGVIGALNLLVTDTGDLVQSAKSGQLTKRADTSQHQGEYRRIVEGINETLDAVVAPVQVASSVLGEMSKGNLNVHVDGNYQGDHAIIQNALNDTINTLKGYISEIKMTLSEIAEGNFNVEIRSEYRGDFVALKNAINTIAESLSNVMGNINNASDQVASGTQQVSDGAQSVSQGSTEQASAIEELTATVTEIAEQTRQNALNASQASQQSLLSKKYASEGNDLMRIMQQSMLEINESSANISKIIKVIDDIAFKTNILALNAAVEAAHAGVHGKGFAVVAEEVRNLSAQSAKAAKETTDLIEISIKKAEAGTEIANNTAAALAKIVESVESATDVLEQIAVASNEQATGISQVNKGIEQMSQVVQTNSATAQQTAAASEELSSQADLLKQMVSRFHLKEGNVHSDGWSTPPVAYESGKSNLSLMEYSADEQNDPGRIYLSATNFGKY